MPRLIYPIVLVFFSLGAALAAPVAEDDRIPLDLRRTTLVVEDLENSLKLYRDALGMVVIYDNMIRNPREATSDEEADIARRLVFLRANDDFVGIVGLLEYTKPRKTQTVELKPFTPGTAVLLFNTSRLDEAFAAARDVPGVRVLIPPTPTRYPNYDQTGFIDVRVSALQDPDGITIELNEVASEIEVR